MNEKASVSIHNKFEVEVRDAITGKLKQEAIAYNIVLNGMWSILANLNDFFTYIKVGTGTGTLSASRTALFTALCNRVASSDTLIKATPVSSAKKKIVLAAEEFIGSVITEVGVGSSATLYTHALLKDSEGNTIAITKTATDVVTIYATIYYTISCGANVHLLSMPNSNLLINYLMNGDGGPSSPTSFVGKYGDSVARNIPALVVASKTITSVADGANKKRVYGPIRYGITEANVGRIQEYGVLNLFRCALPKVGVFETYALTGVPIGTGNGSAVEFLIPSEEVNNLVVKVNGTVVSNYTYNRGLLPNVKHVWAWAGSESESGMDGTLANNPLALNKILPVFARIKSLMGYKVGIFGARNDGKFYSQGFEVQLQGSNDQVNWDNIVSLNDGACNYGSTDQSKVNIPSAVDTYAYLRFSLIFTSAYTVKWVISLWAPDASNKITFDTAPANGATITADYEVDYVPKTDQYVLDIGFTIQFGEVV